MNGKGGFKTTPCLVPYGLVVLKNEAFSPCTLDGIHDRFDNVLLVVSNVFQESGDVIFQSESHLDQRPEPYNVHPKGNRDKGICTITRDD